VLVLLAIRVDPAVATWPARAVLGVGYAPAEVNHG
jgi:hypothetical protein